MNAFTKIQTGLFQSDCGKYQIVGACMGMRGMAMKSYELVNTHTGKILKGGSLAACKKRAEYCMKVDAESDNGLNGWEPESEQKQKQMMDLERGIRSII
jgi:hypothetical protein